MTTDTSFSKVIDRGFGICLIILHWIFFAASTLIILMTDDLLSLTLVNFFIYLMMQMNIIFGDCPLSILEDKYSNSGFFNVMSNIVPYNRSIEFRSDSTLQWIFMAQCLCTAKISLLLLRDAGAYFNRNAKGVRK